MALEKLESIISDIEGRTMGELYYELINKGYSDKEAQLIIQQYMAYVASQVPKFECSHEDPIGWRNLP